MAIALRQSTASQEIKLGPFIDETDGITPLTALTIANTDIKITKTGTTSEVNKNSGGATHVAAGRYGATLDATDTDTLGPLEIDVHVSGALPVHKEFVVFSANNYDSMVSASDLLDVNVSQFGGTNGTFSSGRPEVNTTHAAGTAWGSGGITAGSLASGAIQKIAKITHNEESLYFLRADGNDANDGLTADTARLTLASVLSLMDDGDALEIGVGTFEAPTGGTTLPVGIKIRGAGRNRTFLTGDAGGVSVKCLINPRTRCYISDLTITNDIAATSFGAAIGCLEADGDEEGTDIVIENCDLIGVSDGVYIEDTAAVGWTFRNCRIYSIWDALAVFQAGAGSYVRCFDCQIIADGPNSITGFDNIVGGVVASGGAVIELDNCYVEATGASTGNRALECADDNGVGTIYHRNCTLIATGTGADAIYSDDTEVHIVRTMNATYSFAGIDVGTNTQHSQTWRQVSTLAWRDVTVATPDSSGHPKVTIKSGTGTGEISLSSGLVALSGTQTFNMTGNITGNLSGSVGSVTAAVSLGTFTERGEVATGSDTVIAGLNWMITLATNKITQTATTQAVRNTADNADLAASTVSDDDTTFIRGKFS